MRPLLMVLALGACKPGDTDTDADTDTDTDTDTVGIDALSLPAHSAVANGRFSTSDACALCHDNVDTSMAMTDDVGRPIAPFDLWRSSMMGNAGRDPLWRAVMSAEIAATPSAAEAIAAKCTRCHAPMASADAVLTGDDPPTVDVLVDETERGALARDGVSCTLCHQIEDEGLGTEATFSGNFVVEGRGRAFGPHAAPFAMPMVNHSGFTPMQGDHILESELCATCHTLTTSALDADGVATGGQVIEQAPYLEWQASGLTSVSCQDCHLPTSSEDGVPIRTRIAHNPEGGNFGPISQRAPYGRHVLVGGNTLVPAILRDNADVLSPQAPSEAFDATIAAARVQLSERTGQVFLSGASLDGDTLSFDAIVTVFAGHKVPTGIPVRRAFLQATVTDADGDVVFASGAVDAEGRIVVDGAVAPEETVGGPIWEHRDQVTSSSQVVVYEGVLADGDGQPTFLLMRGEGWYKDSRLLPPGFDLVQAEASGILPVGTEADGNFTGGGDTVSYAVDVAGAARPLTVEVALAYQPLSARWAAELFASRTPEAQAFQQMWDAADRTPERIGSASTTVE